jgi:hypothetical protein
LANTEFLNLGGRHQVDLDSGDGITITDEKVPTNQLRLVGGGILFSTVDKDGNKTWSTGITNKGISASKIVSGEIDTSVV